MGCGAQKKKKKNSGAGELGFLQIDCNEFMIIFD